MQNVLKRFHLNHCLYFVLILILCLVKQIFSYDFADLSFIWFCQIIVALKLKFEISSITHKYPVNLYETVVYMSRMGQQSRQLSSRQLQHANDLIDRYALQLERYNRLHLVNNHQPPGDSQGNQKSSQADRLKPTDLPADQKEQYLKGILVKYEKQWVERNSLNCDRNDDDKFQKKGLSLDCDMDRDGLDDSGSSILNKSIDVSDIIQKYVEED